MDLFADLQKNENREPIVSKLLDYGTKAMYVDEIELADGELTKLLYMVEGQISELRSQSSYVRLDNVDPNIIGGESKRIFQAVLTF